MSNNTKKNNDLIFAYNDLIESQRIKFDPIQEEVVKELQDLAQSLVKPSKRGFLPLRATNNDIKGIYLWGDVGRGKTMLVDLFYKVVPLSEKKRVHYHSFMRDFHREINLAKVSGSKGLDPLEQIVTRISNEVKLLCFDEFQVTDIGDAMILGRLFKELFLSGVVPVITSTRAPDDLYIGGVNRDRFIPFIEIVKEKMAVVGLHGDQDYRQLFLRKTELYITPLGPNATQQLEQTFKQLTGNSEVETAELNVQGRLLSISRTAKGVAWMTFDDLCGSPLGAADYIALAESFHTFLIDEVPRMGVENRNEAKRFITLIDVLYEKKSSTVLSAEVPPAELYNEGVGHFEFKRTVSRILEMQSKEYLISKK